MGFAVLVWSLSDGFVLCFCCVFVYIGYYGVLAPFAVLLVQEFHIELLKL